MQFDVHIAEKVPLARQEKLTTQIFIANFGKIHDVCKRFTVFSFFRFFLQARVLSDNQDNMIDNHNNNFLLIWCPSVSSTRARVASR